MRLFLFDRFHGLEEIICASADLDLLLRTMLIARVPSRPSDRHNGISGAPLLPLSILGKRGI